MMPQKKMLYCTATVYRTQHVVIIFPVGENRRSIESEPLLLQLSFNTKYTCVIADTKYSSIYQYSMDYNTPFISYIKYNTYSRIREKQAHP